MAIDLELTLTEEIEEIKRNRLFDRVHCETDTGRDIEITFTPPFTYLGHGREKIVFSGIVEGLDSVTDITSSVRAAIGIRKQSNKIRRMNGLYSFKQLREYCPSFPTYPWYVQARDGQIAVMPDLSLEGVIVSTNKRDYTDTDRAKLEAGFENILSQFQALIESVTYPICISNDTYFIILSESTCRVVLGDFDGANIQDYSPLPMSLAKGFLRQQASICMDRIWKKAGLGEKYLGYLDREQ